MKNHIQLLQWIVIILNLFLTLWHLKNATGIQNFEEIDVERVNIVESDGTLKMALFNSEKLTRGLDGDKRQGTGTISGMLFYNEEGYETGGLVFDGKKISGGQNSGIGLMFDGI